MKIRPEEPGDHQSILQLTYEAFLTLDYPGRRRMDEHYLVSLLQNAKQVVFELCFVMEHEGRVVGHILYTTSEVIRSDGKHIPTLTFGPLSVLPEYQRQGIGTRLVRHSMEKAKAMGYGAVLIIGIPDYYPKLGFVCAREYGLVLADGTSPDAFMAYELIPGYLGYGGTLGGLAPEYDRAETDDIGFEAFHKHFMAANDKARQKEATTGERSKYEI